MTCLLAFINIRFVKLSITPPLQAFRYTEANRKWKGTLATTRSSSQVGCVADIFFSIGRGRGGGGGRWSKRASKRTRLGEQFNSFPLHAVTKWRPATSSPVTTQHRIPFNLLDLILLPLHSPASVNYPSLQKKATLYSGYQWTLPSLFVVVFVSYV